MNFQRPRPPPLMISSHFKYFGSDGVDGADDVIDEKKNTTSKTPSPPSSVSYLLPPSPSSDSDFFSKCIEDDEVLYDAEEEGYNEGEKSEGEPDDDDFLLLPYYCHHHNTTTNTTNNSLSFETLCDELSQGQDSKVTQALRQYYQYIDVFYQTDQKGNQLIHIAALNGCSQTVSYIIQIYPFMKQVLNEEKQTPLHCAVMKQQFHTVQVLLSSGADPMLKDGQGQTVLYLAQFLGNPQMIQLINYFLNKRKKKKKSVPKHINID